MLREREPRQSIPFRSNLRASRHCSRSLLESRRRAPIARQRTRVSCWRACSRRSRLSQEREKKKEARMKRTPRTTRLQIGPVLTEKRLCLAQAAIVTAGAVPRHPIRVEIETKRSAQKMRERRRPRHQDRCVRAREQRRPADARRETLPMPDSPDALGQGGDSWLVLCVASP